ncbi:Glutamate receptor 2.7 [Morella rubra]|uniref:Glutamate receptor n=1 Tax=Morella rubra TaxID=262757 RepID=A0A6A1UXB6_9ROSI|nr:Glutamate receptor 2.7 [Morella rubra]
MDIPTKYPRSRFFLFFFVFLSGRISSAEAENTVVPVNVGVVLDFDTWNGKMGLSCINMALSDFYSSRSYYKTKLVIDARDSKSDVVSAASAALQLIKDAEVQAIIGPQNSMQADFIIQLGKKAQVPIISFSATSPSPTSLRSPYFFLAAQNESSQVKAICAIIQAFGWRQIVPIYVDNVFGEGIISFLVDALQDIDVRVPCRSAIAPSATDDEIGQELYKLMTMQTRVFVVHMEPKLGSRLFTKAKEIGMMSEGYVWIITAGIANSLNAIEPSVLESMQGVLGVKTYTPNTKQLQSFTVKWKRKFQKENPSIIDADLNVLGLWAYDAASALARAVEEVGTTSFGFEKTNASSNLTHVLETTGTSRNGPKLRQVLLGTRFRGLAGEFNLVNGQLESSTFQIINVNGNGERAVAFWTPGRGLSKKLNASNTPAYSTSKNNIGPIIWPGDASSVPKGWEIPTNGKKLRIGVPAAGGFKEFVNVQYDNSTGTPQVTGYCIDVFKAVMETLPYAVRYEFIPFGQSSTTFDDLVYQVFLGKFDAVVGDVTILANRSNFVDFTLPYTESGVSMVVPITDNGKKNAWVFLKPLTWDLWLTSCCFFVFIGFVVWVLEHRINEDFRGNHANQIGTSLWFSFSTMVFAQREKVVSNCTRFVVIIWIFVVLILTQSYTASLTSLLTVQQLQPTVTDVDQLFKNGDQNVGYQKGSFIFGMLKRMKFKESQLKQYNTTEECDELLSKGTANGGIAAAFDETPYMKLFLGKYCSKYTTVQSVYRTDGFGFVFPKGSPLVSDVSRAILNVTEGGKIKEIESAWFGKETNNCPDSNTQVSSHSLTLASFWGLFLIAGVASLTALIFSLSVFLYKERYKIFAPSVAEVSIGGKIQRILTVFDSLDSLHPAGEKLQQEKNNKVRDGAIGVSPYT